MKAEILRVFNFATTTKICACIIQSWHTYSPGHRRASSLSRLCISIQHFPCFWPCPAFIPGHRFEDNPGVRRHLVKKPSRSQTVRTSKKSLSSQSVKKKKKKKKLDRRPHEVLYGWALSRLHNIWARLQVCAAHAGELFSIDAVVLDW